MQNFFEILGLETGFDVNEKTLESAYFTAQRACHPDRFVGKPEADRVAAITGSQLINDAYETLKNPLTRAEHLLQLQGRDPLSDTAKASPEILMEMMELREAVADAGNDGAVLLSLVQDIKTRAATTFGELGKAFAAKDYAQAEPLTVRYHYLGKAMEEAHMHIYRLKASHD